MGLSEKERLMNLSLGKKIDSHSGKIKVKSKAGEGTEFTVYLPINKFSAESGLLPEKKYKE